MRAQTIYSVRELGRRRGLTLRNEDEHTLERALGDLLEQLDETAAALEREELEAHDAIVPYRPEEGEFGNAFVHRFELQPLADGPLADRPVGVKDTIAIGGMPRTRGRRTEWDFPAEDALAVSRVRKAGGRVVGTLNMDAWSASATGEGSEFGLARHPTDPRRLPGGSSSGAGVALAEAYVDFALGTDGAGSARIPASWCGVVALKPTSGSVPANGVAGLDPSLDAVCPMARTVEECAVLFNVIAGRPTQGDQARRIGIVAGAQSQADNASLAALERAGAALAKTGCHVEEVKIPTWHRAWEIELVILTCSVPHLVETGWQGRWHPDCVDAPVPASSRPPQLIALWTLALEALGSRANELYWLAQRARAMLRAELERAFRKVEILLSPTTPTTAPLRTPPGENALLASPSGAATPVITSTLTTPANLTGMPALALPFGCDSNGLPCSVQLHGSAGDEGTLFATANLLEEFAGAA